MGRLRLAQEDRLEGHHAGTGKQQGRIAERDQGSACQHLVVPLFEEVKKTLADFRALHSWSLRALNCTAAGENIGPRPPLTPAKASGGRRPVRGEKILPAPTEATSPFFRPPKH